MSHEHPAHADVHEHHGGGDLNAMAASATLHCLTGCAIGEILGLVVGTALGLGNGAIVAVAIGLAFVFGYSLSTLPLLRSGLAVGAALSVVLAADTLSIATMEVVDNLVVLVIPGAMNAGLTNPVFWLSMMLALSVAYAAAYPVNRALLSRDKGHALTHAYHSHDGVSDVRGWRRRLPSLSSATLATAVVAFLLGGLVVSLDADRDADEGRGSGGPMARY